MIWLLKKQQEDEFPEMVPTTLLTHGLNIFLGFLPGPHILLELKAFALPLTGQCPKHFEDFIVRIRSKNLQFPCEFG